MEFPSGLRSRLCSCSMQMQKAQSRSSAAQRNMLLHYRWISLDSGLKRDTNAKDLLLPPTPSTQNAAFPQKQHEITHVSPLQTDTHELDLLFVSTPRADR